MAAGGFGAAGPRTIFQIGSVTKVFTALPAICATLTPRRPIPGGEIGLAWHHARRGDRKVIWHNGMTGGFSAMIAFDPARTLGVAALANSAGTPPSPLDQAVLSALD
jgi:CubicO group peptidase (beta-lactamase class C family)